MPVKKKTPRIKFGLAGAALAMMSLAGCETLQEDQTLSSVLIGVAGGGLTYVICKQRGGDEQFCQALAATAGVMTGVIANDIIGRQISDEDNERRNVEIDDATRTGEAQTYETEDGAVGRIEPTNTYTNANGDQCRSSRETITLGGQEQEVIHNRCVDSEGKTYIDN